MFNCPVCHEFNIKNQSCHCKCGFLVIYFRDHSIAFFFRLKTFDRSDRNVAYLLVYYNTITFEFDSYSSNMKGFERSKFKDSDLDPFDARELYDTVLNLAIIENVLES